ncbi:TetR/AcrR family transcriptional regulator [Desulfobacter postgatei]|uniref:Transcriptional regulator n=1 Tax=Desulfobacter postgatei 2ac9 TaxID=879212 RepID=I5AYL2_9BACT|nr:TetR/AcrR family transcriptional regulator [Desulfobacter postgatei]EIM62325.1 transcriptional regulator [Desulfobacter postgatei 2ac9]MDD4272992.1 TetR/AcrR family transcriptional regulator [Desulfobacter postgatei]
MTGKEKPDPPGRIKIMASFSRLMQEKDFHSITTAQIAKNADVTEGLIYKYFKDKKDLLYQVLNAHFQEFHEKIKIRMTQATSSIGKLDLIILASLEEYLENRLLSKILLLEVRNSQAFFNSGAYEMVTVYARTILKIIREGIASGEIAAHTDPYLLRKVIIGAIEHACLGEVIFGKPLDIKKTAAGISDIIFNGVKP